MWGHVVGGMGDNPNGGPTFAYKLDDGYDDSYRYWQPSQSHAQGWPSDNTMHAWHYEDDKINSAFTTSSNNWQYCSVFYDAFYMTSPVAFNETIDFRMYRISENKQKKISMIERIIKENSVDCKLNENILSFKNIKKTIQIPDTRLSKKIIENFDISDKNNSKICDYMDCNIKCNINLEKDELDEKTFNKNILENDIKTLQEHIKLFYFEYFNCSFLSHKPQ